MDMITGRTSITNRMHIVMCIIALIDGWDCVVLDTELTSTAILCRQCMVNWERTEREWTKNAERAHPERPEKVWYVHFWWTVISGPLYLKMNNPSMFSMGINYKFTSWYERNIYYWFRHCSVSLNCYHKWLCESTIRSFKSWFYNADNCTLQWDRESKQDA